MVPEYFAEISSRLKQIRTSASEAETRPVGSVLPFVSGGTDVYVQRPDELIRSQAEHLFYNEQLRGIRDIGKFIEIGASATVTDLLVSPVMQGIFPDLYKHLKLVSSTPIRNMATLAGNFVNASPIGDMTVWFLALDAEIVLTGAQASLPASMQGVETPSRTILLRDLYLGYKQLAKREEEFISLIRFRKPAADQHFNFEKVCKRTYLDIATVNTAISLRLLDSGPPVPAILQSEIQNPKSKIEVAHVAAGGVAPIPLYLAKTSEFLKGKEVTAETIAEANEIMQSEIAPISDVRGTEEYKRLLLRQLFTAHFVEMFGDAERKEC
jgi:xanthine dehydrogenase small subunit